MALISTLSLLGFLFIALSKGTFATMDANVNSWSASAPIGPLIALSKIIDVYFDTVPLLIFSLFLASYLYFRKQRRNAVLLAGAMILDTGVLYITKILVHSPRPLNGIVQEAGFSFPSGHATSIVVFLGLLCYFVWQHWKSSKVKLMSGSSAVVMVLFVGFTRLYLSVHWFSDVLGGYLLGTFLLTFSILFYRSSLMVYIFRVLDL